MSDLISRQAAIDAIRASTSKYTGFMELEMYTDDDAVEAIKDLPSAQPERKVGRWKYETMKHIITGEMRIVRICSECDGGWFRYDMSDGVEDAEPNYCPNCGARMRGEEG